MHYYSHHIGDFIKDTANLTNEQIAAYMKMIWRYYVNEKPFTESCEDIAFAVRSDEKTVQLLLRHFFVEREDGWHQLRCDREIERFHRKAGKARESANARWKNAEAMQTHSEGNADASKVDANQQPITNNQYKNTEYSAEVSSQVAVAPKPKPAKDVLGVDFLIAQGCEESHARDWMKARRAKKAPLTETAWDGLCREARKAGLSPSEAVRMCAARSWASLKAEWLTKDQGQQETTYQRTMREKYEKWVPSLAAKAPAAKRDVFEVIDEIRPATPPALG